MLIKMIIPIVVITIYGWIPVNSLAIELRTAAQNSFPKYYKNDDDKMSGLCLDIINAIDKIEPSVTFTGHQEFIPFKRLQNQLESGQLDVFFGMRQTAIRHTKYIFIAIPLYQLNYVIATRQNDNVTIQKIDDIRKLNSNGVILTVKGSAASTFLKEQGGLLAYDEATNPSILLKMIQYKRGRFAFYHDLGLRNIINREEEFRDRIKILPVSFLTYSHFIAFSKNVSSEVIEKIEIALEKLKSNGTLSEIQRKYLVQ